VCECSRVLLSFTRVFSQDIRHGRWEVVLPAVGRMKLPASVMSALYEQVVVELLECREVELAKEMLRAAPPLQLLRASDPERYEAHYGYM